MGRQPTVDIPLQIGAESTTVEVNTEAPVIDTTSTENLTNISSETLQNIPTGITYQSVIQYAPMARNEPLAGLSVNGIGTGGTGGSMPGSSGNGLGFGYSIGGAADSESSYLVEGQDTENISGRLFESQRSHGLHPGSADEDVGDRSPVRRGAGRRGQRGHEEGQQRVPRPIFHDLRIFGDRRESGERVSCATIRWTAAMRMLARTRPPSFTRRRRTISARCSPG